MLIIILTLLGGVSWTIAYIDMIYLGIKEHTYGMPLFGLALNIAWEVIYAITGLQWFSLQEVANLLWLLFDIIIVYTYFKYGKEYFEEGMRKYFIPISLLVFGFCFLLQFAFYKSFDRQSASQYSAYIQNLYFSGAYVDMLIRRKDVRGQSMLIAYSKCIGTLANTITVGWIWQRNILVLVLGAGCLIFDIVYLIGLWKKKHNLVKVVME